MDRPRLAPTLVLVVLLVSLASVTIGTFGGMQSPTTVCTEMQAQEAQNAFPNVGNLVGDHGKVSLGLLVHLGMAALTAGQRARRFGTQATSRAPSAGMDAGE